MKTAAESVVLIVMLLAASGAIAQPGRTVISDQIEAVVTVNEVDAKARTVTVTGPRGEKRTITIPEANNLDRVKPGDRFKIVYAEAAAVGFSKGGEPRSASAGGGVEPAPKGATPGGMATRFAEVTGIVEAIDHKNRYMTIKGPEGPSVSVKVPEEVKDLDKVSAGDRITLSYIQAVAADLVPQ
jgi:hypothetical protein